MPDLDGFETAAYIKRREKTRHIPIIFLTAISKELHHVFRGYSAGAVDYVLKPFDPLVLRSKVAVFIDLYEKERALRESERRFRTAFEHAPIGIALMTLDGRFIDANRALLALLDRSHADAARAGRRRARPPRRPGGAARLHAAGSRRASCPAFSAEMRFLRPRAASPCRRSSAHRSCPTRTASPLHVIAQVTDLTERHAAERERDRRQLEQGARAGGRGGRHDPRQAPGRHRRGADPPRASTSLVAALLPRVAETLDADAAGIILLDTDAATGTTTASGAALTAGRRARARRPDPDAAGRAPARRRRGAGRDRRRSTTATCCTRCCARAACSRWPPRRSRSTTG